MVYLHIQTNEVHGQGNCRPGLIEVGPGWQDLQPTYCQCYRPDEASKPLPDPGPLDAEARLVTSRSAPPDANLDRFGPVENWLRNLERKVTDDDVKANDGGLARAATAYAKIYNGDFEFMADIAAKAREFPEGKTLSPGQARGVLNSWRADLRRKER